MKASHGVEKSVAQFTNKVFGGWDYCIKDNRAANHKKKVIGGALAVSVMSQDTRLIHLSNDSFEIHITTGKIHVKQKPREQGFCVTSTGTCGL